MKRYEIVFEYADALSGWRWHRQECSLMANNPYEAKQKCIGLYGLGIDCDYRIIDVEEV